MEYGLRSGSFLVLMMLACKALAAPTPSFTYEGYLTDLSNAPVTTTAGDNLQVKFEIRGNSGTDCLLYSELHNNVIVQQGAFSLKVGQGASPSLPGGQASLRDLFAVSGTINGDSCSYNASSTTGRRLLRVYVDGTSFGDVALTEAPRAWVADTAADSLKLGGKLATEFVETSSLSICVAGQSLTWNGTAFACARTSPAGAGTAGQVLSTDGAGNLSWADPGGGGSGITALTGDVTASGTGSVSASIANGAVTASKIADGAVTAVKLESTGVIPGTYGGSSDIPVVSVDAKGRVMSMSTSALSGIDAAALGSGTIDPARLPNAVKSWNLTGSDVWTSVNRVVIGSDQADGRLRVAGQTSSDWLVHDIASASTGPVAFLRRSRGTLMGPTAAKTSDILGGFYATSYNGSSFGNPLAGMEIRASQDHTPAAQGAYLSLLTTSAGSTGQVERLRVDPSGKIGIGTVSPSSLLHVNSISGDLPAVLVNNAIGNVSGSHSALRSLLQFNNTASVSASPIAAAEGSIVVNSSGAFGYPVNGMLGTVTNSATVTGSQGYGVQGQAVHAGAQGATKLSGVHGSAQGGASSGGTIGTLMGVSGDAVNLSGSGSVISQMYGVRGTVNNLSSTGNVNYAYAGSFSMGTGTTTTIANAYGVFIGSMTATNAWGLYQSDASLNNYFAGKVGIGNAAPNFALDVVGDVKASGCVMAGGSNLGGTCVSDRRYKEHIEELPDGVADRLARITPKHYDWRRAEFPEKNFPAERQLGVIAQDVQAQFPELVETDEKGFLRVMYSSLMTYLLKAFSEDHQRIDRLEMENRELRARLEKLERR
ncbi:MAG: tail fiber domain-containing protein [Bdellovibrionaceae bacterium]|nr:tail fiber domain-containing protein [Pseudobdellovibrionaceae bacterium]